MLKMKQIMNKNQIRLQWKHRYGYVDQDPKRHTNEETSERDDELEDCFYSQTRRRLLAVAK